jgi:hypothetical protein
MTEHERIEAAEQRADSYQRELEAAEAEVASLRASLNEATVLLMAKNLRELDAIERYDLLKRELVSLQAAVFALLETRDRCYGCGAMATCSVINAEDDYSEPACGSCDAKRGRARLYKHDLKEVDMVIECLPSLPPSLNAPTLAEAIAADRAEHDGVLALLARMNDRLAAVGTMHLGDPASASVQLERLRCKVREVALNWRQVELSPDRTLTIKATRLWKELEAMLPESGKDVTS